MNSKFPSYEGFIHRLESFKAVSVRELPAAKMLEANGLNNVQTVLDPTLAIDESLWHKASAGRLIHESYVLVYVIWQPEKYRITIEEIKRRHNANRVVYVDTDIIDKKYRAFSAYHGESFSGGGTVGPAEFLSLIRYSEAVFTTSFHGVCMSIAFRKQFYVCPISIGCLAGNPDIRITDICKRLNAGDRMIFKNSNIISMPEINYELVEPALGFERDNSVRFLSDALKKCGEAENV
jgi:hypothetical protein